jgi:hypothetical protein
MTIVTSAQHHTNGTRSGDGLPPVSAIPLTEDDPTRAAADQSIGGLVRDATTHLSTLIRAEVELARAEITAAMLLAAALFGFLGFRRVRRIRGPRRTISTMRDTAAALKRREPDQPREH